MDIGEKIKKNRLKKGLSQEELSDISNVSLSSINKYEGGIRKPKIEILRKIAKALDIDLNKLINEEEESFGVGKIIKEARKRKQLTLKKVAELVGVSEQAISHYERGIRVPNTKVLMKISKILGIDISILDKELELINGNVVVTPLIDKNLGENIKNARKQKGLSQEQLSELTGIPRISLGRYERGETSQFFEVLKRIAKTLECTVANLIGEVNGYSDCNITEFTNEELIEELKRRLVE